MPGRIRSAELANQVAGDAWLNPTTGRHQADRWLDTIGTMFETTTSWLVYALFLPLALLHSRILQRSLLALVIIDIPLQLGTHLELRQDDAAVGSLGGFDVSLTTIALVGLYFSWASSLVLKRLQPPLRFSLWPVLYLLFAALSLTVARDVTLSYFELFLTLEMLLVYIYISSNVNSREDVIFVVTMLVLGLVLESTLMLGSVSVGLNFHIGSYSLRVYPGPILGRVAGTVGSPNVAAGYLNVVLAPAMGLLLTNLGRWYKALGALAFGLGVVCLVLTGSRGGWVAFAVCMLTVYVCGSRGRRVWLPVAIAVNFVLVMALLFHDLIAARAGSSVASRLALIDLAWQVIKDNALLGVGANNFATAAKEYISHDLSWRDWFYTVHNKYLLVWAETGIGGILAFLGMLVVTVRRLWQCWKRHDQLLSPLALGFMAGILGIMTHMLVDVYRGRAVMQALFLIAGLATAMQTNARPTE